MYESIISKQNQISLDEDTHTYKLSNSQTVFTSVTEFISSFFSKFDEKKIAEKLTYLEKYKNKSVDDILNDWEQRRIRGSLVHKEIEKYINDMNTNHVHYQKYNLSHFDLKSQQGVKFLQKCKIYDNNLIFPEVKIFSEEIGLAGTIDLIIYNQPKNQISLIDWKTNVSIKKEGFKNGIKEPTSKITDSAFNKYELQLSMYKYILQTYYKVEVNSIYIIHLTDYSFKYLNCLFQEETIKKMLCH